MTSPSSSPRRAHAIAARLADLVLASPKQAIAGSVLLCALVASGGVFLRPSADYRVFFKAEDARVAALGELERTFTKTDNILFVVRAPGASVFDTDPLVAIETLTARAAEIPFATHTTSLTSFPEVRSEDEELLVEPLVPSPVKDLDEEARRSIEDRARQEPLLAGALLGPRGDTGGVNVTLTLPRERPEAVAESAEVARHILDEVRAQHPGLEIRASGLALMNEALMRASIEDTAAIAPFMCLAMLLLMFFLLRSGWATFSVVGLIALSAGVAMGTGGWLGYPLTPPSGCASVIVLTLCIADGVHLTLGMRQALREGLAPPAALREAMILNTGPIVLTSLTSCVGFLALNFAESPPFHHLANMTTAGILAALVLSLTFLPAMLSLRPDAFSLTQLSNQSQSRLSWASWTAFIARRPGAILALGGILTAFSAHAAWQLQTNDQFVDYFDRSVAFRRDTDFMMEHLSGIYVLDYQLFAETEGGIAEPDYLATVDRFAQWLRGQNGVTHVRSIADIHKRVHQHLVAPAEGARAQDYALPTERPAAAQGLLLYEMSLPEGRDLTEQVAMDKKSTRVTVLLKNITSRELIDLAAASKGWLEQHAPAHMHTEARAPVVIFADLSQRNTKSMMGGNLITLLLISLSLVLTLKSLKLGALSLLPNLMPLVLAYGAWHVFMGDINIIASVAGAICLGLIVDDTLHFLSKLRHAQRTLGHGTEEAICFALEHAGRAMVVTSAILVVGFSILSQSRFQMNSFFGLLVVLVVIAALLADLIVLPAALLVVDRLFGSSGRRPGASWPEDRVFMAHRVDRSPIAPVPDAAPSAR